MQPTAQAHIADFAWSLWLQAGLYQIILTFLCKLWYFPKKGKLF
jgi:hypothetical protein